jgi:hypothetical protein
MHTRISLHSAAAPVDSLHYAHKPPWRVLLTQTAIDMYKCNIWLIENAMMVLMCHTEHCCCKALQCGLTVNATGLLRLQTTHDFRNLPQNIFFLMLYDNRFCTDAGKKCVKRGKRFFFLVSRRLLQYSQHTAFSCCLLITRPCRR